MGTMPMIMASAVIRRAEARGAGFDGGADGVAVFLEALLGEGDDEDAVGGGDAHAHDGSHQRGHAERGVGEEEEDHDAGQRRGQRGDDDEGIEPRLEVDDDEQVDEDDGEAEAAEQAGVGAAWSPPGRGPDEGAARQALRVVAQDALDVAADGAEVAALHVAVDIDVRRML
jgi:hypothetical protein